LHKNVKKTITTNSHYVLISVLIWKRKENYSDFVSREENISDFVSNVFYWLGTQ